jgi:N12 class adenine-specific DNA methylase
MAHEVGAGKTYAAIGLGYEMKRLGAIHKPLYAVPNHLVANGQPTI